MTPPPPTTEGTTPDDATVEQPMIEPAQGEAAGALPQGMEVLAMEPVGGHGWAVKALSYSRPELIILFVWLLLGDFAWSARDRSVGPMAQWYVKQLGVSNFLYAVILSTIPAAIALIVGPIVSFRSDRHRSPEGRRIPYLVMTTILSVDGMAGMAFAPYIARIIHDLLGTHSPSQNTLLIATFAFFWAVFSLATSAAYAVFYGLINDVVPPAVMGRFFALFRIVSLADGIIFNMWLVGKIDRYFMLLLLAVTGIYAVCMSLVCWKVKEGEYPPPPLSRFEGQPLLRRFGDATMSYMRDCFKIPYYLLLFFMMATAGLAQLPINTFSLPQSRHVGISLEQYGFLFVIQYICSFILAYPIGLLVDKFHPLRVTLFSMALYGVLVGCGTWASGSATGFRVAFVIHGVTAGVYNTGSASLGQRLYPRSRFAQFASAAGILSSLASLVVGPMVGAMIDFQGDDYRYAFAASSFLALLSFGLGIFVYRRYQAMGGDAAYTAP